MARLQPLASVVVITYNQQQFVAQAIRSLVTQQTDFPYEIIVSDDCSTDGTWDECLKVRAEAGDLVKLVRPESNLGINGNLRFVIGHATGQFIAICEGDDYWIDPHKLQRQVDALTEHDGVDLSVTRGEALYPDGTRNRTLWDHGATSRIVPVGDYFAGYGLPSPTASLMWRAKVTSDLPDWFDQASFADQIIQIAGSRRGGVHYDPTPTVVYRIATPNSFTLDFGTKSISQRIAQSREGIAVLEKSVAHFQFPKDVVNHKIIDAKLRLAKLLFDNSRMKLGFIELCNVPLSAALKFVARNFGTMVYSLRRTISGPSSPAGNIDC